VQGLIGIDIADAGHQSLIEKRQLDRYRSPFETGCQLLGSDAVFAGAFRTKGESSNHCRGIGAWHQPQPAELPDVAEVRHRAIVEYQVDMR